jgi:hypothetical protein
MKTNFFFHPSLLLLFFGSEIRDPGWVKIRIRDPKKHPVSATLVSTLLFTVTSAYRVSLRFLFLQTHTTSYVFLNLSYCTL